MNINVNIPDSVLRAITTIADQISFTDPDHLSKLEAGYGFATVKQAGTIAGLLRRCGVPEEWRLLVTGQLIGRELHESSKEMSWVEARHLLEWLLYGADGQGGNADSKFIPCDEARETVQDLLTWYLAKSHIAVQRASGAPRAITYAQSSFLEN